MLSVVFPLAAIVGVSLWLLHWVSACRQPEQARMPEPFWSGKDSLCLSVITLAWALIAFIGLGDTEAPQSFLHYTDGNQYAQIELQEPTRITALRYYSGLGPYDYTLEFSTDGVSWIAQTANDGASGMTQSYTQLFRWNDAALDAYVGPTRYIRIISGAEQWLGEIALWDENGERIDASRLIPAAGCEALLDEQTLVPERASYKNGSYFDEIYHARTAYEHIQTVWPYEITHPPLGKLLLSLGIRAFGMTPFGWRFSGTLMGVLMLPALYVFLKKLFRDTVVSACGTVIFAVDFMHFTQCRIATIDSYVTFFILLMFLFMWLWLTEKTHRRLYLALCGISFGLGAASKWTGFYAGAGLALLWLFYWLRSFRRRGRAAWGDFGRNVLWCLLFFVAIPALIYYVSYYAYGLSKGLHGVRMFFSRDYLRIVLDNQSYMWNYHSQLVAEHPYSSRWYQWLVDARPILYWLDYYPADSRSVIAAFNNPLLSWGGLMAMLAVAAVAVRDRDKTAAFIVFGYLINLLPWVPVSRLTFAYHYFPCTIFLTLAIAYLLRDMRRRNGWRTAVYGFTGGCIALFAMFYPVLSGVSCSETYSHTVLKWFGSWPF